jgi:SAM-dependent methyltransferase
MTALADKIQMRLFPGAEHPYRQYERRIAALIGEDFTIMDAGCGYTAPLLAVFRGKAKRLVGVDRVNFAKGEKVAGLELHNNDLAKIDLESASVDLVISRSVLEHIKDIEPVYREIHRVLKPGGHFLFLVPNFTDYVSLISWMVPNKLHGWIVSKAEGRSPEDTFPTFYNSNTLGSVRRLSQATGFELLSFDYVGQYPSMLKFNAILFLLGSLYEKLISRVDALKFLRGWILADLRKSPEGAGERARAER